MKLTTQFKFQDLVFFSIFLFLSCLVLSSPTSYEGGDNFIHYKFAHYSWQYPHLFLDHWGKPLYTILSSPFAQFGFNSAKFFNVIFGCATAYITYLVAIKIGYKNSWLSFIFVCFAPIYFVMFNTAMTEVLFSFILICGIYCFFTDKYFISALLISFLPFARSEGYLFILFFGYTFLVHRKLKYTPVLTFGFLFFSILGYFYYYHDFLWVIHKNPYNDQAVSIYGTGELLYFLKRSPHITGYAISTLILLGIFSLLKKTYSTRNFIAFFTKPEFTLILFPAIVYFAIHSLIWWLGKYLSSVGEIRVIAAIIPLFSLVALKGWNDFLDLLLPVKRYVYFFNALLLLFIFRDAKEVYRFGYQTAVLEKVVIDASDWLKQSSLIKNKIYYYDPFFFITLNINPYDNLRIQEQIPDCYAPENFIKPGEIIIWDAHYSPNEGKLPLIRLLDNNFFELKNIFSPGFPVKMLGGNDYEIYIFQRLAIKNSTPKLSIYEILDFEKPWHDSDSLDYSDSVSLSGNYSFKLDNQKMYLPLKVIEVSDLLNYHVKKLRASVNIFSVIDPFLNHTALVVSFERDTSYDKHLIGLESTKYGINKWNEISIDFMIPPEAKSGDKLKVVAYQPGNHFVYIDNLRLEILKITP